MQIELLLAICIGFALDMLLGDPQHLPHPVRWMGLAIQKGEALLRKLLPQKEFFAGLLLTVFLTSCSFGIPFFILLLLAKVNIYVCIFAEAWFCYRILAVKALKKESMRVHTYLLKCDIPNARKYLSYIVGRDTEHLDEAQIAKAAVETVAENTSDGVVAPLFYMMIGGAPLGFFYKAANTLDSMIGYKNEKYLYFGRFAAKLDDVLNFIPAILSAYFMLLASWLLKLDSRHAWKIYRRDKHNHASPNSAKTEAVAAGALHVQLAGDAHYFGKLVKKPTIGDDDRPVQPQDIATVNRLLYATAVVALVWMGLFRILAVSILV